MTEREIFLAVIDLPDASARTAYLDCACATDPALRLKVESLIRSHQEAGSFLGTPAVARPVVAFFETHAIPSSPQHDADTTFTSEPGPTRESDAETLAFLAAPGRPNSLGRIGHYEVLQVLGRGAFGIVLRALDDVLQRVVAVKVLAPQLAATSPARKRFLREARTSAQIRHENVVQVHEVGEQPLPYLVMEFIPGESLQQRLDRTGPVEVLEVVRIGRQVAEGLAAAHASDLIHRDIKPGNILLEGGQQKVKITDFGLARAADDASISQSGIIAGTPMYMAPEQAKGEHIDHRADLFSLGGVLYQMATGRPPFRAKTTMGVLKRVAEHTPRPIREIIPETPQWLCDIIAKLHAKNPDDRFQSAREVADLLATCEARLKSSTEPRDFPTISGRRSRQSTRRGWIVAAGVLVCAVIVAVAAYFLTRPDQQAAGPIPPVVNPGSPTSEHDPERDRKAAIYVLSIGGDVQVSGADGFVGNVERLPKSPFALTSVYLRDNKKVTDEGLGFFQGCRNVRHLDMAVTRVTDAGLENFKDCHNLTVIDLFSTNVSDVGLALFKDCKFTFLSLRSTRVSDAVGAYFAHCTELEYLGLGHTQVTESGLARFRNCKKLKVLDLDVLAVGDASVTPFADCNNLEQLNLSMTQVTDRGIARFKECKSLKSLNLRGTKITAAGIDDLKAALPACRIEWDGGTIEPSAFDPFSDADVRRIAALPAADQVEEVRKALKSRNPGFGGLLTPTIEDDTVVALAFSTDEVADIAPVRALPGLKSLACAGTEGRGKLVDLSPLRDMSLVTLDCNNNGRLADLSALKGMATLKGLFIQFTHVPDLAPLTGMRLDELNCSHTRVADLAALKGMPLAALYVDGTKVTDLTPLKGMPLKRINLRNVTLRPDRDADVLRSLDQLEEINSDPVADFLKKLDGK
jgi:serine/threonine protein kinase/Leucine-rich repeat (LRR) protein